MPRDEIVRTIEPRARRAGREPRDGSMTAGNRRRIDVDQARGVFGDGAGFATTTAIGSPT